MLSFRAALLSNVFSAGGGPPPTITVVEEFSYTGAAEETTVPSGYTSVTVWLWGGAGGNGNWSAGTFSGGGGIVRATFPCSPGDTLKFEVAKGGDGAARNANGGLGGWPDGGDGGRGDGGSGGGGGSTRFYINSTLKAVAGGGGGCGGGGGGSPGGGGGTTGQSATNSGGTGGSQIAGGVDANDTGNANKTGRSIVTYPGAQRTGGFGSANGNRTVSSSDDGGGGGGGYWGGGGGGGDIQSGGGGSSWTDSDATNVVHHQANLGTPSFTALNNPTAGVGVNSGSNGSAVAGANGYAIAFFGTPYSIAGGLTSPSNSGFGTAIKTTISATIGSAVKAKWLCARAVGTTTTNSRAVIYADSGGNPGALVGTAGPIATAGAPKFLVFDLADLDLPAGTYWFGVHTDAIQQFGHATSTGAERNTSSDTYADGSSDPFGTATTGNRLFHFVLIYL